MLIKILMQEYPMEKIMKQMLVDLFLKYQINIIMIKHQMDYLYMIQMIHLEYL